MSGTWIGFNHLVSGAVYGDFGVLSQGIAYNPIEKRYALFKYEDPEDSSDKTNPKLQKKIEFYKADELLKGKEEETNKEEEQERHFAIRFSFDDEMKWLSRADILYEADIEYIGGLMAIPDMDLSVIINGKEYVTTTDDLKNRLKDAVFDKLSNYPSNDTDDLKRKLPLLEKNGLAFFSDGVYTVMNSRNEAIHFDTNGKKLEGKIEINPTYLFQPPENQR